MNRISSVNLLKLVASFFVICIHTKTISSIDHFEQGSFSFVIDNIAKFAVPFFFIASGYLLNFNDRNKMIRKLATIFFIYLVWSVVFISIRKLFDFSYPSFQFTGNDTINDIANTGYMTLFYGHERHLWFFPAYIIAAGMISVLKRNKTAMIVLVVLLYIVGLTGQQLSFVYPQRIENILNDTYFTRSGVFFAFPCMAAGYFIKNNLWFVKDTRKLLLFLIPLLFLAQYAECVFFINRFDSNLGSYHFSTLFLSAGVFIFCLNNPRLGSSISLFTTLSGGVYVLHGVFIYLFIILKASVYVGEWWPIMYTPLLFVVSLATAYLFSRNRILKKLIFS